MREIHRNYYPVNRVASFHKMPSTKTLATFRKTAPCVSKYCNLYVIKYHSEIYITYQVICNKVVHIVCNGGTEYTFSITVQLVKTNGNELELASDG